MALTPEQVLNKHFQTTQFRRGYEERDVDDFLDEVVAEMRRIVKEGDDLRDQLNECRQTKGMPAVAKADPRGVVATTDIPVAAADELIDAELGQIGVPTALSSYRGKPSSGRISHAAAERTNVWPSGLRS